MKNIKITTKLYKSANEMFMKTRHICIEDAVMVFLKKSVKQNDFPFFVPVHGQKYVDEIPKEAYEEMCEVNSLEDDEPICYEDLLITETQVDPCQTSIFDFAEEKGM